MIGRGDRDGIDLVAQFAAELLVAAETRDSGVGFERVGRAGFVDTSEGDEVFLIAVTAVLPIPPTTKHATLNLLLGETPPWLRVT